MLLKKLPLKMFVKIISNRMLLKLVSRKTYRSKRLSKIAVAEVPRTSATKTSPSKCGSKTTARNDCEKYAL